MKNSKILVIIGSIFILISLIGISFIGMSELYVKILWISLALLLIVNIFFLFKTSKKN